MKNLLVKPIFGLLMLFSLLTNAQDGSLDNNFGGAANGLLKIDIPFDNYKNTLKTILVQPDGKIVVGGTVDAGATGALPNFYLNRFNANGTVDGTFNSGTANTFAFTATQPNSIEGMALQPDGTLIFGGYTGYTQKAVLGKLSTNGSAFIADAFSTPNSTTGDLIKALSYNKTTNTIALAGYDSYMPDNGLGFRFSNNATSCPLDASFNSSGFINLSTTTPPVKGTKAVINMDDGSMLLGGYSNISTFQAFTVVKLRPNGTLDNTFGTTSPLTGIAQIPIGTASFVGTINAMALLPTGQILVAGILGSTSIGLALFNANGTVNTAFNKLIYAYPDPATYYTEAFSLAIQPDGKILVSGTITSSGPKSGIILRCMPNGVLDATFGVGGVVVLPNAELSSSALSTKDGYGYFAGKTSTNQLLVAKVAYKTQAFNILGKDIVNRSSQNDYFVHPYDALAGYTYTWSVNNTEVFTRQSTTGDSVTLYFSEDTNSTILTCQIKKSGTVVKVLSKKITVNPDLSLAQFLAAPVCSTTQTDCQTNYINAFSIKNTKLTSFNTGCSEIGYYDYTSSSYTDTLYIGDNYQATLEYSIPTDSIAYVGIWIDYNNDGKISDAREFVASGYSKTGSITLNNILIPTGVETGPKRIRVRLRLSGPFTYSDFCAINEEASETEDYLTLLNKYDGLKTPNFITPNDDGKNDFFIVQGIEKNTDNNLKVFNRIGDLVYEIDSYDNTWQGKTQDGTPLKPGTYYYVFTQKSATKKKDDTVKGFLELRY